ncbi:hypothetical protein [Streptomyces sp. LN699]|uniref:hypothetical protein n=1 Tax=Streptomyces sp. LN699 TaxID=3112981 RepID=UPI003712DB96
MNPDTNESAHATYTAVPGRTADDHNEIVAVTPDGLRLEPRNERGVPHNIESLIQLMEPPEDKPDPPDLAIALAARGVVYGMTSLSRGRPLLPAERNTGIDHVAAQVLVVSRSQRWREAVSTALLGSWCDPLWDSGHLPVTALGALKAEARVLHRQLVPVWQRGPRHGRVLSLDADLGGLSLYDLVASNDDLLEQAAGTDFTDERLIALLPCLNPAEQQVVFALAGGEGTTWTEAAAVAGATDPEAFGERVRRKTRRLAAEQRRRTELTRPVPPAA